VNGSLFTVDIYAASVYASPLEGEAAFQCEQKTASISKAGEGYRNGFSFYNPSPEFLKFVPHFEILPSPPRGEGNVIFAFLLKGEV